MLKLPTSAICICALGALLGPFGWGAAANAQDQPYLAPYQQQVQPVLKQRCISCHGPDKQEADLRLDTLSPDLVSGPDAETWHDVLNKVNLGEMPPAKATALSDSQRQAVVGWLTHELRRAAQARKSTGGLTVLRRLTRYEYNNTMRDLLGVDLDYAQDLPPDPPSADGFQNNGAALGISPMQIELYLKAARLGLSRAIVIGDKPTVFTHQVQQGEKGRSKKDISNYFVRNQRFLARMMEFPRQGEMLVRVRASAVAPDHLPIPRMRVTLGHRADVLEPEKTLAEVDVIPNTKKPHTFEFRGRIEDFPLPGHNPKYPGLQINLINSSLAGPTAPATSQPTVDKTDDTTDDNQAGNKQANNKQKNNKKKAKPVDPVDLNEPLIVIESMEFEGPLLESWPPSSHTQILFASPDVDDEPRYVREVLERFLTRAYRRPATQADVEVMAGFFEELRPNYPSFEETIREVLALALISPDFLYLVEPREKPNQREPLTDYELASRISYFLWSSMPDERLFQLASSGSLRQQDVLDAEVQRMIADPKSRQFVQQLTGQWFDLGALDRIAVNPEFYPSFDDRLKSDMRTETQRLFATILDEDLSCLTLLDADFALLNYPLAKHYGITGPRGLAFERVALSPTDRRGGLLAQGSFLLSNSNGEDSHPIKRAVWLLDRLLDNPPAPPPPDVPELDSQQADLAKLPLKQQLEIHRKKQACNDCHRGIDPWGVVFENYDAVGRWRTQVAGPVKGGQRTATPVDASATLPDGTELEGLADLKQYMLGQQRRPFAEAVVKRLLTYSLGRSLDLSDQQTVESLASQFAEQDYRLRGLMVAIVQSEAFQTK